jgi:hypothetical protein
VLDQHPHAAAVLGAALEGVPAHAYLLHGPAGAPRRATSPPRCWRAAPPTPSRRGRGSPTAPILT